MPVKNWFLVLGLLAAIPSFAQKPAKDYPPVDTTVTDYDLLFSELDAFLDSITAPRSFTLFNLGITSAYFNFEEKSSYYLQTSKKMLFAPSISYFGKSGLGFSVGASVIDDGYNVNPYQYSATLSYDYIRNRKFMTGVSLTHFITKDNLAFYTSPLQNEAYAYFTYRNFWIKPTVGVSYGWGSRSDYEEREEYITSLQLAQRGFTRINTQETVNDFNLITSVRHDFYWLHLLSKKDYARVTPQIVFSSGTHQFGFNQTSNTYASVRRTGASVLYSSERINLDNSLYFQPISLAGFLKAEYGRGKFFVQPQLMLDYYFPATENNFTTSFVINAGFIL